MKNPLNYQTTEYDCGPTTMINAISYLFKREEIPPDVIKHIVLYGLDAYNEKGESGKHGTSQMAMAFIASWLNQFGKVKQFPILCQYLTGPEVFISQSSRIVCALQQGGAAVVRLKYEVWHYVLLTGADDRYVYLFDSYYRKRPFAAKGIDIIKGQPTKMNRRVAYDVLNGTGRSTYAMGPEQSREAVILFNCDTQKTPADTIEYFI
ncbi:MAG: peptidase C39 [Christensenellales bacterium]|jgi:hypothetical protein